ESPEGDPRSVAAAEALPSADHWVWKTPAWPELPAVGDASWPRTEIDRFILAKLESAGLSPSPEVDRRVWLRRVTFALAGLPPTPDELAAFLEDDSPDAYERVVDRLLASPTFGETWGSHWLDLVRFAETHGHEQDFPIPEAWRYRDYVIRALNADVPYDALLTEHVAGDLIAEPRIDPRLRTNESAQGTGFWHLGEATHSPVDIRGEEADRMASSLDVFGRAFQGLAFGCVRCHDHKFDPIPQDDYYALYGFLQSSSRFLANVADPERNDALLRDLETLRAKEEPRIVEAFVALWKERTQGFADDVLRALKIATATPASVDADDRAEAWRRELERAKGDLAHPLWIVARLASDPARADKGLRAALARLEEEENRAKAALRSRVVERTLENGERNYVTSTRPASPDDVVVDFDAPGPTDWHAGDRAFGDGPRKAGEVRLGQAPESPIVSVLDHGEATVEPRAAFSGFLRTRTFEVTSNTLWYRYRGEAEVFLAVDSHRVVAGPLHGVVRQHLAGTKGEVRWFPHSVRDYIGHRVHVEFTPKSRDFALLEVRFSKDKPGDAFRVNRRVFDALARLDGLASPATIETAARAVE
ncbi:MAG TPA: DUF1549 domain-containing protein, partial [Planctomycetota bacterium]|nr:DUF1549 domain-containing protein [Planctomycetota bacterium]